MFELNNIDISEFNQKLGLPAGTVSRYLDKFLNFYENHFPRIVDYFSGKVENVEEESFRVLDELLLDFSNIDEKIIINNNILDNILDWDIVDFIQETEVELKFATKISKFLRSTLTNYNYIKSIEFDYVTTADQTLEDVSREFGNKENYGDDWIGIALRNNLSELDYDNKGGNSLKIGIDLNSTTSNIKGVVDNINGKKILGIDLDRKIQFIEHDLKTLSYDETASQSADILAGMYRGDNPEFESMGRTPIVGNNKNSILYTTTIRELSETFSSDDTFSSFSINNVENSESDVKIKFEIVTRAQEVLNQEITI